MKANPLGRRLSQSIIHEAHSTEDIDLWVAEASAELGGHMWLHVGHTPDNPNVNNAGTCEVASDKRAPIAEISFNLFDALIHLAHLHTGLEAKSPHEAVREWSRTLPKGWGSAELHVIDSGHPSRPTLEFRDDGHGQHPDDIHSTFLSLHSGTKLGLPHLCGKFGMGLKSSFKFCDRLVLVTKPHESLLNGRKAAAGVAVVRKVTTPGDKGPHYEYLCSPNGRIIRLDAPGLAHGSTIRLSRYDLDGFHGKINAPNQSLHLLLNSYLIDPPLPLRVSDRRKGAVSKNMTVRGLLHSLEKPKKANSHQGRVLVGVNFEGETSNALVRYYVLHPNSSPRDKDGTKVKSEQAITFSHNGQRHGSEGRAAMRRLLDVGMAICPRLAVVVDTSALHPSACGDLYSSNRINANSGSKVYEQIMDATREALRKDEEFRLLEKTASENMSQNKSGQTEKLEDLVSQMIHGIIQGRKGTGGNGTGNGASGNGGGGNKKRDTDDSLLPEKPTRILVDNQPLKAPRGKFAHLTLDINAKNGYISPGDGRLSIEFKDETGAWVSSMGELAGGKVRLTVRTPDDAAKGKSPFTARIVDRANGVEISARGTMEVVEPKLSRNGNGNGNGNGNCGGERAEPVCRVSWLFRNDTDYPDYWDQNTPGEGEYRVVDGTPTMKIFLNGEFGPLGGIQSKMSKGKIQAYHLRRDQYARVVCGYIVNVEVNKMETEKAFAMAALDAAFKDASEDDTEDLEAEDESKSPQNEENEEESFATPARKTSGKNGILGTPTGMAEIAAAEAYRNA